MPVLYYEDLEDGHEQWGGEIVVDREEILAHAKEYDPWPFHTDDEAAKESVFCGLVASGGFVAGQTRHFQSIYRDSVDQVCGTGQNTTNAVSVTFEP